MIGQELQTDSSLADHPIQYKYESLILPSTLIGFGIIGLESHTLKNLNSTTRIEFREHIDKRLSIDDFSQYSAFLAVYGLNSLGVKGKNSLTDRTIILGSAYIMMGLAVNIIKRTGNVKRPDGTSKNSFPSGHTATAFMGAEFLFQEYKSKSKWYGVAGYIIATGTGFFRMYNDRHWLTDVAAGAGIGILTTKLSYLMYPYLKTRVFKNRKNLNGVIVPYTFVKSYGLKLALAF